MTFTMTFPLKKKKKLIARQLNFSVDGRATETLLS